MTAEADADETAGWRLVDPWTAEARLDLPPEPLEPDEDWLADQDAPPPAWVTATAARQELPAGFWRQDPQDGRNAGSGFECGGGVDKLKPGAQLAGFLELAAADLDAGLPGLNDDELVGFLGAARRMGSWAAGLESGGIGVLARRRAVQAKEPGRRGLLEHLNDELAAALTITSRAGSRLLSLAGLLDRLPAVRAALLAGTIDWARAVIFAEMLAVVDDDAKARDAAGQLLPGAGGMTTSRLRARLRRIILGIDPQADEKRRKEARRDTAVQLWEDTSGNYTLAGRELPPARALASDRWLTAQAWWLRDQGMTGTLDELRAAVFLAVLGGGGLASLLTSPTNTTSTTTSTTTGAGTAADTGEPATADPAASDADAGHGTSPSDRDDADAGPDEPAAADPAAGSPHADAEHGGDAGGGRAGGAGAVCGTCGSATGPGGAAVTGSVNLTMPLASYLGLSDAPGEAAGFGPVDVFTGRELASWLAAGKKTRWCLTLTDQAGKAVAHACARRPPPAGDHPPSSPGPPRPPGPPRSPGPPDAGAVASWLGGLRMEFLAAGTCDHQRESSGYRPSRTLRHLIQIRQPSCSAPCCGRASQTCDLDHVVPYDQGGRTCQCNLHPPCRRHHRAKQADGWHVEHPEPGKLDWTLPHGRTYSTEPDTYPV